MPTRKDFRQTAAILKSVSDDAMSGQSTTYTIGRIAEAFAAAYAEENPRFNVHLFLKACGLCRSERWRRFRD